MRPTNNCQQKYVPKWAATLACKLCATSNMGPAAAVQRGGVAGVAHCIERAGDGNIIDVMPRSMGERAILAPSGHTGINQPGIFLQQFCRPQP